MTYRYQVGLALLMLLAATMGLRLRQVRDLAVPAWVDALHHVSIVEAIQSQQRLPYTLADYDAIPFYYHFGFHVTVALHTSLTGMDASTSVLLVGQILNALIILTTFGLAQRLTHSQTAALIAAVLTSMASRMPSYYAAWSRFTLTAGMVLLPLAMATLLDLYRDHRWAHMFAVGLLTAGLWLTHYVVAVYYLCFAVVVLGASLIQRRGRYQQHVSVCIALLGGLLVVSPWLFQAVPYILPRTGIHLGHLEDATARITAARQQFVYLWSLVGGPPSLAIAVLAAATAVTVVKHRWKSALLIYWVGLLVLLSQKVLVDIRPFRPDLVVIILFLPANILAAQGFNTARRAAMILTRSTLKWLVHTVMGVVLGICLFAVPSTLSIVPQNNVIATEADVQAIAWIRSNIPQDKRFLINVAPWGSGLYRGTEGSYWLPLLSGHATVLPPGIFYGWSNSRPYIARVRDVAARVLALDGCTDEFWFLVKDYQLTHIYIGTRTGPLHRVYWPACAGIEEVYSRDGIYIYAISPGQQLR